MINIREMLQKDLQNEEIQENLMYDIVINEKPLKAIVSSGMIEAAFMFGGHDTEGRKTFKIPRQQLVDAGLAFPLQGDLITYSGNDYEVVDVPDNTSLPLLSYTSKLS